MNNCKLVISYVGTHYLGWQKTKTGPSIEEALEGALRQMFQRDFALQAASRTDRGVHAEGQVVNFGMEEVDLRKLQRGLNGLLPQDIRVVSAEYVAEKFHPTLDAVGKEYHYRICNGKVQLPFDRHFSWHFPYELDIEKMRKGAQLLMGTHDFSAFCNEQAKDPVRRVDAIEIDGNVLIRVRGNHFLYKMVRNLVGTLVYIGCGKIPLESLLFILQSKDRKLAGVTAPAHGLTLKHVFY